LDKQEIKYGNKFLKFELDAFKKKNSPIAKSTVKNNVDLK